MAEFHKRFPNQKAESDFVAVGDLDKDGLLDFVTFLGDPMSSEDLKIGVLLGTSRSSFRMLCTSGVIPGGIRRIPTNSLEMKKGFWFLHRSGPDGPSSDWTESFQFQMRDGALVLIGEESTIVERTDGPEVVSAKSINYLSGDVLFSRRGPHKSKEFRKKFSGSGLEKLCNFDYDSHFKNLPEQLKAVVDKEFHLRP